ncbi:unnamed protein product [Didymodactylos carnosus]|uniref:acylglycerol lipase n=1 Tax=Didymodactylos carnosus TaxID=1234261 RepID=A0A815LNK1_9BILA|nr:unnamed protein product [Didymodactylos carnosus]CAF1412563.1 unnamed protein product [Didymodactylos carnosus]CAF3750132.1 unnamed protein product [Didymodactylos carnosus]CAF4300311.1 unnamed protein product [Didymodactylos carnosus]
MHCRISAFRAGVKNHSIRVGENAKFSYGEKGVKVLGQPTILFVHGLSSNKETFLPIIKDIPDIYHVVTVDLPGHGSTVGLNEDFYTCNKFADSLKKFIDALGLVDRKNPNICLIGASMGGSVVLMFSTKYPEYVKMVMLLAPPADESSETDLIRTIRAGDYDTLLPQTCEQFHNMVRLLTIKRINLPRPFLNGFLKLRRRHLDEHRKEYDYPQFETYHQQLRSVECPVFIIWGREDKLFTYTGAEYFRNLIPNSEIRIVDECGHFMAIDQPELLAQIITAFYQKHFKTVPPLSSRRPFTATAPVVKKFDIPRRSLCNDDEAEGYYF